MENFYWIGVALSAIIGFSEIIINILKYSSYNYRYKYLGLCLNPIIGGQGTYKKRTLLGIIVGFIFALIFLLFLSLFSWLNVIWKFLFYIHEIKDTPEFIKEYRWRLHHSQINQKSAVRLLLKLDNEVVTDEMIESHIYEINELVDFMDKNTKKG